MFDERPECQNRLIKFLENMGYEYVSRSEAEHKRKSLSKVIFEDELIRFLSKQTYKFKGHELLFSGESVLKAINALDASLLQGLSMASKEIYNLLILGISLEESITIDKDIPVRQSFDLNYIDFEYPANNIWQVTEEFSVERANGQYARPDVVLMVNGIPLVVIECKKSSIDVKEGVMQNVRNMMPDYIPQLFKYSQIVLAVNPNKVYYGTAGTTADYFVEWREQDTDWQKEQCEKYSPDNQILEQDRTAVSLIDRRRLLDLIRYFILYDSNIKKIARHQQFFAISNAMDRINGKDGKDSKGGVIWHTQGSGKSLTMVMLVRKIQAEKGNENPRFVIVTDRINLDKQIRDNFANSQMAPVRAATGKGLKTVLKDRSNIVITTLINKFETVCKNRYLEVDSHKFYVLIDEAHRSQYSTMYNYMREVLPNATIIAFTGTPLISKTKKNTYKKFGEPIHNYTMKRSIEDKVTVPLVYEGRKVIQNDPTETIDSYFDSLTKYLPEEQKKELKVKFSRFKAIAEARSRINLIAFDIYDHFINYCVPKGLKAMVVCSSRGVAVEMFNVLKTMQGINPRVVISFSDKQEGDDDDSTSSAVKKIKEYHEKMVKPLFGDNDEKYDESVCEDFKNPEGEINMLIVKDKLLTGFDAPIAGVLYLDKSIKEHSLLQAVARVNRVYKDKDFGLIVDYWGVFSKLNKAIDMYNDAESGFNQFDEEDIADAIYGPIDEKNKLAEAHKELLNMFSKVPKNATSNEWQKHLAHEEKRKEFYEKLKTFANLLNLALINREIFTEVGFNQIEKYRADYLFYKKLKDAVTIRYDDSVDYSKYEDGIKNLIDTFVNATDISNVIYPVSISDERSMNMLLETIESYEARGDVIKTKIETKLKQIRYDDPLLFEEFSTKIKKTLAEYNEKRDADKYYATMETMADDLRNGRVSHDYPDRIANDSDAKAFYGSMYTIIKQKCPMIINEDIVEIIGENGIKIKESIAENTKRDWKHNEMVHKAIHRELDDYLFDMFENMGIVIDNSNVDMIDLIIDEIMKVAVSRY
jgi:type I restriction enzyme R subunit